MKVTIRRGAGSGPGLVRWLDSAELADDDAGTLRQSVQDAVAFAESSSMPARPQYPHDRLVEVEVVDDDGATRTIHVTEAAMSEGMEQLLAWVDTHPSAR